MLAEAGGCLCPRYVVLLCCGEAAVYVLGMSSCWAEAGGCLCPRYVVLLCWVKLLSMS